MPTHRKFVPAIALAVSVALAVPAATVASAGASERTDWPTLNAATAAADVLVTGRLVDHKDKPIDNYHVSARDQEGDVVAESLTYGGRYELWLPEGATVTIAGADATQPAVWAETTIGSATDVSGTVKLGKKRLKYVAPRMAAAPVLRGTPLVGNTVEADTGTWAHAIEKKVTASVVWVRGGTTIATGPTYTVKAADANKQLGFVVTARSKNSVAAQAPPVVFTAQPAKAGYRIKKVTATSKKVIVRVQVAGSKKQTLQLRTKGGKSVAKASGRGTVKLVAPGLKKKQKKVTYFAGNKTLGWTKVVARR